MIDDPGPWGTGPFTLAEGRSVIDAEQVVIARDPFACTWLQREERTPRVRLVANPHDWDTSRGPYLKEVVFRNDLTPERALDLVCTIDGEVDILTEVPPAAAARVEASEHARLVSIDAVRTVVAVINRDAAGLPFHDRRARQALNLAVDRDRLVADAYHGWAVPLAGLTPLFAVPWLHRLSPYPHDPKRAAELWREAVGDGPTRPLRIAGWGATGPAATRLADDLRAAMGVKTELTVVSPAHEPAGRRRLAEKTAPPDWDLLVMQQTALGGADAPPLEYHRAFVGATGEYRAGPVVPEFEARYAEMARQTNTAALALAARQVDQLVYDEALVVFLCAPQALYAVNRHVEFTPYRTTFELADCRVGKGHWSRR